MQEDGTNENPWQAFIVFGYYWLKNLEIYKTLL